MKINLLANGHDLHAEVLRTRLSERIGASYGEGGLVIELAMADLGAEESYRIDAIDGGFKITGSDTLGLFYGIGKFLHSATWTETDLTACPTDKVMTPHSTYRALYFPIHFYNWYQNASVEDVSRYLEDLLLWGFNILHTTLPIVNAMSMEDELVTKAVANVRRIFKIAKKYGMKTSLSGAGNQGYKGSPHELDAEMSFDTSLRGDLGRNLCFSKPGTLPHLQEIWKKKCESFLDIGLDFISCWPYDEGGCGCKDCRPWGGRKYPDLCNAARDVYKQYYPNIKFVVSTWAFDAPNDEGEYAMFYERLKTDLSWVDYLMVDSHHDYPRYPLEHPVVRPIVNFPEIAMWGLYPWGGFGANPLPERFERIWKQCRDILSGGMPYSEGLYEDISKVQCGGYYWNPDATYEETLGEYINYEYGADVIEDTLELMRAIEINHTHIAEGEHPELPVSDRAFALAKSIDARLSARAKKEWRWRILYIRAILDKKRYDGFDRYLIDHKDEKRPIKHFEYYSDHVMIDDKEAQDLMLEMQGYFCCSEYNGENHWTLPPVGGTRYEVDITHK